MCKWSLVLFWAYIFFSMTCTPQVLVSGGKLWCRRLTAVIFPGCLNACLKAALSQRACLLPVSPVEGTNHPTKLNECTMRLLALIPIFCHILLWHPHGHLIPPIMFLCFYSLLMRQERGVSGCVHWCDRLGVCWMRVNACASALSHLPITGTCRVITESWPWRSGPRQGALYSLSFKGSHPTLIRHAQLVPPTASLCASPNAHVPPDSVFPSA